MGCKKRTVSLWFLLMSIFRFQEQFYSLIPTDHYGLTGDELITRYNRGTRPRSLITGFNNGMFTPDKIIALCKHTPECSRLASCPNV